MTARAMARPERRAEAGPVLIGVAPAVRPPLPLLSLSARWGLLLLLLPLLLLLVLSCLC